jgi:ABC-type multidrug transport system fused ATPase/permease subunit
MNAVCTLSPPPSQLRAIAAAPDVIILDDVTSSLDATTEKRIVEGLYREFRNRTAIIISQKISTIRNADQVLVLHNHNIIESGIHDSLMAQQGFYGKLYGMQDQQPGILESNFA